MPRLRFFSVLALLGGLALLLAGAASSSSALSGFLGQTFTAGSRDAAIQSNTVDLENRGRQTFREDTFGSEKFFTGTIQLNQAIQTVPPTTALAVGLKVDLPTLQQNDPALVNAVVNALQTNNTAPFQDPQVTLRLIKANAVVGVRGTVDQSASGLTLTSMGITCALCHSTVQDAGLKFANGTPLSGIGTPLDGVPNRDLDVGTIISLAPNLQPVADLLDSAGPLPGQPHVTVDNLRQVLRAWGPGKFDAEVFMDGKVINPATGKPAPTLIPPAYGLAGVNMHTFTGWGSVTYWNAFVANLEMHGQPGTFFDPRLDDKDKFPIAAVNHFGHVSSPPDKDRITDKLAALHFYQLSLPAPPTPFTNLDPAAVAHGKTLFETKAKCETCHVEPLYTEPGWNMHKPKDIGIDDFQAERSPDERYRTTPLGGLGSRAQQQGGFYHDGRFKTLLDVVNHYDQFQRLGLTNAEKQDLVTFLESL